MTLDSNDVLEPNFPTLTGRGNDQLKAAEWRPRP